MQHKFTDYLSNISVISDGMTSFDVGEDGGGADFDDRYDDDDRVRFLPHEKTQLHVARYQILNTFNF